MKPKPVFGKEAKVVTYILDNNHYRKITLNDSMSSAILDSYIKNLDNNKTYFNTTDLAGFEKYRTSLDDQTRAENV
ncbi:MAG TPA: tail-specific protease, partial [Ohtaekwangia sp.]